MEIEIIEGRFAVCQVQDIAGLNFADDFLFIGKTDEELSVVCKEESLPTDRIACDNGWRAFRVKGALDFALVGILAKISATLAEAGISIFAVSTYRTDYVLVKGEVFEEAVELIRNV